MNPVLPSDVCLLLRADAEQCWLHREVIPVLREVEAHEPTADDQAGVALAYLEAMWDEAVIRARATDAAHASLGVRPDGGDGGLGAKAGRYHAAVRALRELVGARVAPFVVKPADEGEDVAGCMLGPDGCAPRAA